MPDLNHFKTRTDSAPHLDWPNVQSIEGHYDDLCRRFGALRVNAAIRARILENRLWRTLSGSGVPTPQEQPQ